MAPISNMLSNDSHKGCDSNASGEGASFHSFDNYAMLLDSGQKNGIANIQNNENSRYDIFCAYPCLTLTKRNQHKNIEIKKLSKNLACLEINHLEQDPLEQMRNILNQAKQLILDDSATSKINDNSNLPFQGGWLGYFSYDFGESLELQEQKKATEMDIPLCSFGLYRWAIISDHKLKTTKLYNFGVSVKKWNEIKLVFSRSKKTTIKNNDQFQLERRFKSNVSFEKYQSSFKIIQENIVAGNCYQINYAHQFKTSFKGNVVEAYQQLTDVNQSPFSAYLNFGDFQILSLSPEKFISVKNGNAITQPIKGTAPRDKDPIIDKKNAAQLLLSEKDRAENLMIVDLLRNDLSKTADIATVNVPELFGLYTFESVHHLISTITSQIAPQYDVFDILQTCLPGGSITGAPKIAAMKIIDQLEEFKRGIYCGVIGYMNFNGDMDTNICIRTILAKNNQLLCCAGGGIVFDSTVESEYQETFHKISKIIPVLEEKFLISNLCNDQVEKMKAGQDE